MYPSTHVTNEIASTLRINEENWVTPIWGNLTEPLRQAMTRLNEELPASYYCVKMTEEVLKMKRQGAVGDSVKHAMQLFCAAEDLNVIIAQMQ